MTTTALRIELLIIGFQASIWLLISLDLNNVYHIYIENIDIVKDTSALIILIVIATCYSVGAMIDSITAAIEDFPSFFKPREYNGHDSSIMRLRYPDAYKELVASDFELRLLRSTAFNLFITCVVILIFTEKFYICLMLLAISVLVTLGWYRRKKKTERRRKSLYQKAYRLA
ncbi:hypothetical protein [Aeromonas sp. R7-5]|uniref:hypothetical protein n=1 Tax=Aeromonas sp. R7-5 TaxID=3138477 RepID=UPI0034A297DD